MDEIHNLLLERNAIETSPFLSVHAANAALQNLVEALQSKCELLERQCASLQEELLDVSIGVNNNNTSGSSRSGSASISSAAATAALKSEARLRDKLETVQEELHRKLKNHAEDTERALETQKDLASMKDLNEAQGKIIADLKNEMDKKETQLDKVARDLQESQSRTDLAEQQYMGLKTTIRTLQEENDVLKKENHKLVERVVTEKEKVMEEVTKLTKLVDKLKAERDMIRTLQKQEQKRTPTKSWFGKIVASEVHKLEEEQDEASRKFGTVGVTVPSQPKYTIQAHSSEASCVRYDGSGTSNLVASCGNDSTVKVWDTGNGSLKATLRGGTGHTLVSCDIGCGLVVGGGSDKTCRVWSLKTERMIHQLVGHGNKIACVRLLNGGKGVITGSADRSLKLWDISRNTYRQTTTLRHSSTSNCVDVGPDACTAVSGHMDGGVRFWDIRSGERTADIADLHAASVTSVQFHPTNSTQLLTNGKDSCLRVVDVRTCKTIRSLEHKDFKTTLPYSASSFSPDGTYAAAGCNTSGDIFVWRVADAGLKTRVSCHTSGVGGFAWGRGGTNGQQVASVDRKGSLILWA